MYEKGAVGTEGRRVRNLSLYTHIFLSLRPPPLFLSLYIYMCVDIIYV